MTEIKPADQYAIKIGRQVIDLMLLDDKINISTRPGCNGLKIVAKTIPQSRDGREFETLTVRFERS